jgi:hypothetical protein
MSLEIQILVVGFNNELPSSATGCHCQTAQNQQRERRLWNGSGNRNDIDKEGRGAANICAEGRREL